MNATAKKTRYVARYMVEQYWDEENQTGDPDQDKYGAKAFSSLEEAGKYGCEKNCYGSECFVEVQEWRLDEDWLELTGWTRYTWQEVEEWLFQDGEKIERTYPE